MATDDRTPKNAAPPAAARAPSSMEPIRVRQLRSRGSDTNLPPPARGSMLVAGKRATGEAITIVYEPWQRHHRVREIGEDGAAKTEVCIPESWVAYTPEEPGA